MKWGQTHHVRHHHTDYYTGLSAQRRLFINCIMYHIASHLPGKAALTEAASLLHCQYIRVSRAGKQQLPNFKGFGNAETSSFSRTVKPLNSLDAFGHRASFFQKWLTRTRERREVGCGTPALTFGASPSPCPNNSSQWQPKHGASPYTNKINIIKIFFIESDEL